MGTYGLYNLLFFTPERILKGYMRSRYHDIPMHFIVFTI